MTERGRYWRRWLGKWERSGLTQAEFCRRHGLKAASFAWWKHRLGEAAGSLRSIPRRSQERPSPEFVEFPAPVRSTAPSRGPSGYELVLPRGVVIRLPVDFDSDRVVQLLTLVGSAC